MSISHLDKSVSTKATEPTPSDHPLDDFAPAIDLESFDFPALVWPVTKNGRRMAFGLVAMGFTIAQIDDRFRMRLDTTADRLLLKLYDVATGLRWRNPDRQIDILEDEDAEEKELVLALNGGQS